VGARRKYKYSVACVFARTPLWLYSPHKKKRKSVQKRHKNVTDGYAKMTDKRGREGETQQMRRHEKKETNRKREREGRKGRRIRTIAISAKVRRKSNLIRHEGHVGT